jgi:hypothetical protein
VIVTIAALSAVPLTTASAAVHSRDALRDNASHETQRSSVALDLAKLGNLTNYSAKLINNGAVQTFRVHSPTDWEEFSGKPQPFGIDVNGSQYALVVSVSGASVKDSWKRIGPAQAYGLAVPYQGYARGFAGLTRVTGVKLVRGTTCHQAGIAGSWWRFASAVKGAVYPHVSACIAVRSGWLLSYYEGTGNVGLPSSFSASFEITGVNNVPMIAVPHGS